MLALAIIVLALRHRSRILAQHPLDLTGAHYRAEVKAEAEALKAEMGGRDQAQAQIAQSLGYDPWEELPHTAFVRRTTLCPFAASAQLWTTPWPLFPAQPPLSTPRARLLRHAEAILPTLNALVGRGRPLHLDGLLVPLPPRYGESLSSFGAAVRLVLGVWSEADPGQARSMAASYLGGRGWWFEYAREPFFVSTLAPCYPPSSPRWAPVPALLLQPSYSFAWRNILDAPGQVRDQVRAAFAQGGRAYVPSEEVRGHGAALVVRPLEELKGADPLPWWRLDAPADWEEEGEEQERDLLG